MRDDDSTRGTPSRLFELFRCLEAAYDHNSALREYSVLVASEMEMHSGPFLGE